MEICTKSINLKLLFFSKEIRTSVFHEFIQVQFFKAIFRTWNHNKSMESCDLMDLFAPNE